MCHLVKQVDDGLVNCSPDFKEDGGENSALCGYCDAGRRPRISIQQQQFRMEHRTHIMCTVLVVGGASRCALGGDQLLLLNVGVLMFTSQNRCRSSTISKNQR